MKRQTSLLLFSSILSLITIISCLLIPQQATAQPHFDWVRNYTIVGRATFIGRSISVDNQKNVYITGNLNNPDFTYNYGFKI